MELTKERRCLLWLSCAEITADRLQKLLQASGYKGPRLEATRGVALLQRGAGDHVRAQDRGIGDADRAGETELDPHAWQSAANGIINPAHSARGDAEEALLLSHRWPWPGKDQD